MRNSWQFRGYFASSAREITSNCVSSDHHFLTWFWFQALIPKLDPKSEAPRKAGRFSDLAIVGFGLSQLEVRWVMNKANNFFL